MTRESHYRHKPDGTELGSLNDDRRWVWAILIKVYERAEDGADWNDVLDEAETRGVNREWTHNEIKRRLRWGDAHLYEGNLYPHYEQRSDVGLLYYIMQSGCESASHAGLDTRHDERAASRRSLWRIVVQNSGRRGARIDGVIETAEGHGMDWMWIHEVLELWTDRGYIDKSQSGSRVVPQSEEEP